MKFTGPTLGAQLQLYVRIARKRCAVTAKGVHALFVWWARCWTGGTHWWGVRACLVRAICPVLHAGRVLLVNSVPAPDTLYYYFDILVGVKIKNQKPEGQV